MLISYEAKDHQGLAPLALSPGVGTVDSQTPMAILREIREVGGPPESQMENGHAVK